jgi:hypothetical protein
VTAWSPNAIHLDDDGMRATFRRGFVESVRCPLAAWAGGGGACRDCRGTGDETSDGQGQCGACKGTGRTSTTGIGPRVVAAAPVVEVVATDRRPEHTVGRDGWERWVWFREGLVPGSPAVLPARVWEFLPDQEGHLSTRAYPTEAAANLVLFRGLVDLARDRAEPKLPKIRWPEMEES